MTKKLLIAAQLFRNENLFFKIRWSFNKRVAKCIVIKDRSFFINDYCITAVNYFKYISSVQMLLNVTNFYISLLIKIIPSLNVKQRKGCIIIFHFIRKNHALYLQCAF